MGVDFWSGILIGFGLSIFFWFVTTQILVARLTIQGDLEESHDPESGYSYSFLLSNKGQRDAIDVAVRCTLYSHGWATDDSDTVALIDLPVSLNGSIDIMEGRHHVRNLLHRRRRRNTDAYAWIISFRPGEIPEVQKRKLTGERHLDVRRRLESNQVPLAELMELGTKSEISVSLLAFDRLSGTRNISTSQRFCVANIKHNIGAP